jgi:hypothetical protein
VHSLLPNLKMSFGFSPSDFVLVTQLAYSTVQDARRACGAHSTLAREVNSLHVVLVRLRSEVSRPESILSGAGGCETGSSIDRNGDGREEKRKELAELVRDCERVLKVSKEILEKVCISSPFLKYCISQGLQT